MSKTIDATKQIRDRLIKGDVLCEVVAVGMLDDLIKQEEAQTVEPILYANIDEIEGFKHGDKGWCTALTTTVGRNTTPIFTHPAPSTEKTVEHVAETPADAWKKEGKRYMESLRKTMPLLDGFSAAEDVESDQPPSNEKSVMLGLFQMIIESCHPEDDTRADVAYSIARHLKLDCPCAYPAPATEPANLLNAVNALLHQIDIGDFMDSHGHSAKMLKPVHDLIRLIGDTEPAKLPENCGSSYCSCIECEKPEAKAVPLSSMPELQAIVAKGISNGTFQINGATEPAKPSAGERESLIAELQSFQPEMSHDLQYLVQKMIDMLAADALEIAQKSQHLFEALTECEWKTVTIAKLLAQQVAVPQGWKLVPVEPTITMVSAMASSRAKDDEGDFPALMDLIGFSGENKTHTALKSAYQSMLAAAPQLPQADSKHPDEFTCPLCFDDLANIKSTDVPRVPMTQKQFEELVSETDGASRLGDWATHLARLVEQFHGIGVKS